MSQGKKRGKRSLKALIVSDVLMLICVCMLVYPIFSDIWNKEHSSYMFSNYSTITKRLDKKDYDVILQKAREYNESLAGQSDDRFWMTEEERKVYQETLTLEGTDVMAYLSAPTIGVYDVPVYHGTSNAVLQVGVGHFEGSSLPIGGPSTHTVLSGHTGMAGMKMFSDLESIRNGDLFQISVLNEVLTYEVDDRHQVVPEEVKYLDIEPGQDYCTLITCVPIGINSERLLIRGHRVPTPTEKELRQMRTGEEEKDADPLLAAWEYLTMRFADYELIMAAAAVMIVIFFMIPDIVLILRTILRKRSETDGPKRPEERAEKE